MSEYIKTVIDNIHDARLKEEIRAELTCHIEEKTEFYLKRGFTEEEAREKAEEDMGKEPLTVANMLTCVHARSRHGKLICDILLVLLFVTVCFFEISYFIFFFFGAFEDISVIISGGCFSLIICMLLLAIKKKYAFLPWMISLFSFTLIPYSVHLNFITNFFEAISGGLLEYYVNIASFELYSGFLIFVLYLCFMIAVFVLGICTMRLSLAYQKNKFGHKMLKLRKNVTLALKILLVFTVFSTLLVIPGFFAQPNYQYEYVDGLALIPIESEEAAEEVIERHVNDYKHIEKTERKCYYIGYEYDTFSAELKADVYVNGEAQDIDYTCDMENKKTEEKQDLFVLSHIYKSSIDIEAESGYLLVIPLIGYSVEEMPSQDIESFYSAKDAYVIELPLNEPHYIMLNQRNTRYELKLY